MSEVLSGRAKLDGFRMPAEWEPHDGCWMIWPEGAWNWRAEAGPAQEAFVRVATAIAAAGDPVTMGVSAAQFERARELLPAAVRVVEMPSEGAWVRDHGPTFVVDHSGERRAVDWLFNAWGGLYEPHADLLIAQKIAEIERTDIYRPSLVLEGGSIHVDGEGTCLTTEQCLLNPNRNPGLTKDEIEAELRANLGVEKVIWLGDGVIDDVTSGHVDNLACFARPGVVCLTWEADESDPQHAVSADALARLEAATDAAGRKLEVVLLPSPGPLTYEAEEVETLAEEGGERPRAGDRLAGSYVNFYIANRALIVPLLDPRTDEEALAALRKLFPERSVIGIECREILLGGGDVHCITQQVPSA